jgi:DNA-binding HxlR family transcriptional regulator
MPNVQTEAQAHIAAPAAFAHKEAGGYCPRFHYAAELLGRRWTGAIIRELTAGPRRFNELLASIPGLSDRLLCERLRELEGAHIVDRDVETGPPVKVSYALTKAGRELEPVLAAIAAWAERWVVR